MTALAQNLVQHFGANEVATWYFEVWNEPNIDFWGGIPRDKSYYELYEHTAKDLKAVNPRLRVGGPSTAAATVGHALPEICQRAQRAHRLRVQPRLCR